MKKIFLSLLTGIIALVSCGSQNSAEQMVKKSLVIYYSQTGSTRQVAQEIASLKDADTLAIEVEQPYGGTYEETIARVMKERETGELPTLKPLNADLAQYDTIYLGYPIWFGNYAPPIAALVKDVDFAGKTVVPFCTFGSGGRVASREALVKALPKASIAEAYGVRAERISNAAKEVKRFLIENGYMEGEVEKLPDYSQQKPVSAEEAKIFDAACGDYKYPLGTPVTVGKRATADGTDYKFTVNSKDMQGNDVQATIYVTVGNNDTAKPEFTEVVR